MRSDLSLTSNLVGAVENAKQLEDAAVQQMSSGKRLREVSDDPAAAAELVTLNGETASLDAYNAGSAMLRSRLAAGDSALATAVQLANRAISLGVAGANGTNSAADRQAIATELQGISDQLLSVANSQFGGRYLFSGEADHTVPFAAANGVITYQGASFVSSCEIAPGMQVPTGKTGDALFGASGTNIFDAISSLIQALQAGTNSSGAQNALSASLDRLTTERVVYGDSMNAIDESTAANSAAKQRVSSEQDRLEAADLTAAASQLTQAQLVQSAASAAFSKVASMNLFDYLSTNN